MDPIQLQRLVDGELSLSEIQRLLKQAQSSPEHWETIATALIENQLWQQQFELTRPGASAVSQPKPTPMASRPSSARHVSTWVLAASVFFSLAIGYWANEVALRITDSNHPLAMGDSDERSASNVSNAETSPLEGSIPSPPLTPAVYEPDYMLEVPELDAPEVVATNSVPSSVAVSSVPLYRINNPDQWRHYRARQRATLSSSDAMIQQMSNAGFRIQQEIKFISGKTGDELEFIVPVRTIRFVPVQ